MSMLDTLKHVVHIMPTLLDDESRWDSLVINRRKPFTYRMFTKVGNYRVCLHKFDKCDTDDSFYHPHPWPGAFVVLSGAYQMKIGRSKGRASEPVDVAEFIMRDGSAYEISDPLTWHSVTPLTTTYTIMVNGKPWDKNVAHKSVRTTKGKDLEKMSPEEVSTQIEIFKLLLGKGTYGKVI